MYALANLQDSSQEGGYAVRHSKTAITDFGQNATRNPLAAAFPVLFPYGVGSIEAERKVKLSLREHAQWALQYYDRRFAKHHSFPFVLFALVQKHEAMYSARLQMRRQEFERDNLAMASITVADLREAEAEERRKEPITNAHVRALRRHVTAANGRVVGSDSACARYRGMIWGTCLLLRGPSLWLTINPADIHDPIAQIFVGEDIDMDKFNSQLGPDSSHRAENIASNPYAAAEYFHFVVNTTLESLFGISKRGPRTNSEKGILGHLTGYFGVVEAQGRGSLHVHMLLWLSNAPNVMEMHAKLQEESFREQIRTYIKANVRAHLDDLGEHDIKSMTRNSELAYSQPPDPCQPNWAVKTHQLERQLARSQQVHTCSVGTCLRKVNGQMKCKRKAPWPLSNEDYVDNRGNWGPKRTYSYINGYCPLLLTTMRCNNDLKINMNGADTKDVAFYITAYAMKKQKKTHNLSALMASAMPYHTANPRYEDIRERNRLLLYRCINMINRETELSGPQVASYLMGYGDTFTSHNYAPLYTTSFFSAVRQKLMNALHSHENMR